jgi:hypothetical protein
VIFGYLGSQSVVHYAVGCAWVHSAVCVELHIKDVRGPEDEERRVIKVDAVEEYLDRPVDSPKHLVAAGAIPVPQSAWQMLVFKDLLHRGDFIREPLWLSVIIRSEVAALGMCVLMVFLNIFFAFMVDRAQ